MKLQVIKQVVGVAEGQWIEFYFCFAKDIL